MKVINVRNLISQKRYSGTEEFEYEAADELITFPFAKFSGKCKSKISYWILEDDSVEVKGSVRFTLAGQCSRCLRETKKTFSAEVDCYYVPAGKKIEEEDYTYSGGKVDFEDCVRDAIMLGMPFTLLCSDGCTGIEYKSQTCI